MSWFKFSKNYLENIIDEKTSTKSTGQQIQPIDLKEEVKDPSTFTLEYYLSKKRQKNPINLKEVHERNFPNNYFSHGQGGEYRMQEGRDYVWNQTPDNFINTSDWNS